MKTWLLVTYYEGQNPESSSLPIISLLLGSPTWIRTILDSHRLRCGTMTIKCFNVNRRSSKAKNLLETHYSPISHGLTIWTFD